MAAVTTALIQTVRALDQTGPGADGEHLTTLYRGLAASPPSHIHAAEESALRWLLKVMSPGKQSATTTTTTTTTSPAELVQRFPTTWRVLGAVFERVPLFSLAKALADRRFVAVLRQTLERLAASAKNNSSDSAAAALGKRKRGGAPGFDSGQLASAEGALATADALFDALRRLVERMRGGMRAGGHARMGAEHVKSLFCLPAAEAATLVAPMLALCRQQLQHGGEGRDGEDKNVARWAATACAVWDLHLQGQGDASEVAMHLARPACLVLGALEGVSFASAWRTALERFLHENLILPSRGEYLIHKAGGILATAMDVAAAQADVVGPALHAAATRVYRDVGAAAATDDDEWVRSVFRAAEEPVRALKSAERRTAAVLAMIRAANGLKSAIATADLQEACTWYGLEGGSWAVVRAAAELDQTLFFVGKGGELLEKVCEMLAGVGKDDGEFETAVDVAVAIVRGFGTARNLHSFVRRWHAELARAGKDMARRVWFSRRLREGRSPLVAELETRLSPQQVVGLVGHISAHKDAAAVVVAATLADGLAGETYVDTVGTQLYDVVAPHLEVDKGRGVVAAQAWRVVAHTAGWSTADAAAAMWAAQGKQLKRVLKKASAAGDECAREAFQAAGALWRALYPDGEAVEEVQDVVVGYLGKMGGGAAVPAWEEWKKNGEGHEGGDDAGDLGWVLYGPARVAELLPHSLGEFPIAMAAAATKGGGNVAAGLLANQVLADDTSTMRALVDHLASGAGTDPVAALAHLQRVPVETWSREQRRLVMRRIVDLTHAGAPKQAEGGFWPLALGVAIRLMRDRPTFYDGMAFADLVAMAADVGAAGEEGCGIPALFGQFAGVMVRQTAACLDDEAYFSQAAEFVAGAFSSDGHTDQQPLNLCILEALLSVPSLAVSKYPQSTRDGLSRETVVAAIARGILAYTAPAAALSPSSSSKPSKKKKRASTADAIDAAGLRAAMDAAPAVRGLLSADFVAAFPARQLEEYADGLLLSPSSSGAALGWRVKAFLVANFAPALQDPRPCRFGRHDAAALLPGDGRAWRLAAGECVDAVLAALPREEQLAYAWELVRALDDVGEPEGRRRQLFALRRAVDALVAMPDGGGGDRFGFAGLHGELAARLRDGGRGGTATMATPDELARLLDLVHVLLDKKAGFMTQWSVESTLGAVCVLCCTMATMSTTNVSTTPTTPTALVFPRVFAVVETLIKRHRVRLEGHYHIITTTLQCLLAVLMAGGTPAAAQETHARMFARLVTLLCTPTAGAVGRPHHHHHGNPANAPVLDSATAAAKRFAGQYMYVVLTAYVRLLLEGEARQRGVGRAVRDALEPAWHAAFDVMPPDTRRILNDGMDEGGREVVREMWKRYTLFGKWSGV